LLTGLGASLKLSKFIAFQGFLRELKLSPDPESEIVMLISYQWLRNYLSLPEPAEVILPKLVKAGVEVGSIRQVGGSISKVIVAELIAIEKHPQADRLSLTKVSTGKETLNVVCGAKNIAVGQKVPLAQIGAVLPGDFKIKASKIRGVDSEGMLCSAKELGLAADAEGIFILPPNAPIGEDFLAYMGLPDTLFELEITPNRSDLLSHIGLARELGALLNRPVQYPKTELLKNNSTSSLSKAKITIEAKDLCFQYHGRLIENIKIGPSPLWLIQALQKIGQNSINNVVDITNYVLMELGQPLHAFDFKALQGSEIIVRRARPGEKIPLLDGTERELNNSMLVIADAVKPVALAGIMGGSNSQVIEKTQSILLEAALFLSGSVRKTARTLGISTDSSYRFERGIDAQGVERSLDRAADLILQIAGGTASQTLTVITQSFKPSEIKFRPNRCRAILGADFSDSDQVNVLKSLGCNLKEPDGAKECSVVIPSYRVDLTREIDLIEEVARVTGYDKIPLLLPRVPALFSEISTQFPYEEEIRFIFHQAGLNEAVNSSFLSNQFTEKLKLKSDDPLRLIQSIANPIADDQDVLRSSLLPSLLLNVQTNLSHQQTGAALYELNKVFFLDPNQTLVERRQIAVILAGELAGTGWQNSPRKANFYDVKGLGENLIRVCRLAELKWEYDTLAPPYHFSQSFQVKDSQNRLLLKGGAIHPRVLKEYDISAPCFALEVDLDSLALIPKASNNYKPLPKFPGAWRDIALVVPDGVTSEQVMQAIESQGGDELKKVWLFDLYRGTHVAPGHRSLAYRLQFQNVERTLTDQELTEKVSKITEDLKMRYSIALR
jgi:phenylalanyl-tRNA synthetase beta chain